MLYYIFRYLEQFNIPGSGIWSYISFRSILALIVALIISMWFGEWFIRWMKKKNRTEAQRDANIDPFGVEKKGVPTMGGIIIIVATIVPCLLFGRLRNIYMLLMLITTVWLGLLGFLDDYLKGNSKKYDSMSKPLKLISEFWGASAEYRSKNKNGLRPICKLVGQFVLGLGVGLTLWLSPDAVIRENITRQVVATTPDRVDVAPSKKAEARMHNKAYVTGASESVILKSEKVKSTKTTLPFVKNHNLDYAGLFEWLGRYKQAAGWIFFVLVTTFIIMAVSNGSNLNDGLDGMCAGNSAIMCIGLGALAYFSSHIEYASYFDIMYIPESQELVVFIAAFVGALVGFLWYNAFPAQIFMGDTGSLPIGGIIGVTAIIIHKELLIPILCFVFLAESLSVMAQNAYAKKGNAIGKKFRFVNRAPIHDAFRLKPEQLVQLRSMDRIIMSRWPRSSFHENKVTMRFWIVTIILTAVAILTLKIR